MIKIKSLFFLSIFSIFSGLAFSTEELPEGYRDIKLGMTLEETKEALLKDSSFGYHGDRDVSLIPGTNRTLIETDAEYGHGSPFLSRCWFQFTENSLYTIIININPDYMDYYSVFTALSKKYGSPDSLNPQGATWKNETTSMTLEKPLTLKYIDLEKFQSTQNYNNIPKTGTEITREMFLDEL